MFFFCVDECSKTLIFKKWKKTSIERIVLIYLIILNINNEKVHFFIASLIFAISWGRHTIHFAKHSYSICNSEKI